MELTIRPSSSTPKEFKFRDTNRYLHTHVQRTVHNSQRVRTTQVSINWRADKQKRGPATQQNIIRPQGGMKLPVLKQAGHRNVTPRMLITFSHTALHPSKLPQKQVLKVLVKSLSSHVTKLTMVIISHVLIIFHVLISATILLYTLNLPSDVCQLHQNKTAGKI